MKATNMSLNNCLEKHILTSHSEPLSIYEGLHRSISFIPAVIGQMLATATARIQGNNKLDGLWLAKVFPHRI